MSSDSKEYFSELLEFIIPTAPEHFLKLALQPLLQLDDNNYFLQNLLLKEKLKLFENLSNFFSPTSSISCSNFELILTILVNLTAIKELTFSNFLINSNKVIPKCMDLIIENDNNCSTLAIKLFCNLSRQFPKQFANKLIAQDPNFGSKLIGLFFIN